MGWSAQLPMETPMTLDRRSLGSSGLLITRVGFGSWAVGGGEWAYGWGAQDDDHSVKAITHAVSRGVNWVDTAGVYGLGHSEEVVGRALRGIPASERPHVFTKGGLVWDSNRPMAPSPRIASPASLRREIEASLRRLGVETIDLYQIHWPDESGVPVEDAWGEMGRFVDEGKTRLIGLSNFGVELLERCETLRHVDSLQPPFSLIARDSGAELIPWCAVHGTGVIVYSPMGSRILTETFTRERAEALPNNDWRARNARFREPALTANLALRDALRPIAARRSTTVEAVAVAWTLAWPGVTGAIVGARRPAQVDGWVPAANVRLEPEDLAEIEAAVESSGAGDGPVRPVK
jgi:aryl-alcohol dehydrogenase-like predicted oxidoreductase